MARTVACVPTNRPRQAPLTRASMINRSGKLADVHIGEHDSQGTLDGDIKSDALQG